MIFGIDLSLSLFSPLPFLLAEVGFWFGSVAQSCLTLCNPMDCSTSGLPVHHQLPEFTETHVHWVGDTIQPSQPQSSPSPHLDVKKSSCVSTTERGASLRFTCGSLCCHLTSHWLPWRYSGSKLALSALLICCQNLLLVKPRFFSLRVVRVYSLPLLTCALFTSQQHCRSSCLNHICSPSPGFSRERCSICSGVIPGQPHGFSLSTFHIARQDHDGIRGHRSLLCKPRKFEACHHRTVPGLLTPCPPLYCVCSSPLLGVVVL